MKFEEIKESILKYAKLQEEKYKTKTIDINCIIHGDSIGFFLAKKDYGSESLFIAFKTSKNNDCWIWICPTEE